MNIEQIAIETWMEVSKSTSVGKSIAVAFANAFLSKLAEQDVEPVAVVDEVAMHKDGYRIFNGIGEVDPGQRLYTETKLIAAQQRTAEACAKVCMKVQRDNCGEKYDMMGKDLAEQSAESIRNGEWMEFL